MSLFILLGVVVLIALGVLGFLFFMLSKEGQKEEQNVVPLRDFDQIRKELNSGLLEPLKPKDTKNEFDIIPPFEPKVSMPTQPVVVPLENDTYKKRAQELEEELKTISQKAEGQSLEAKQMIETLTEENESLKRQKANLEEAQLKLTELQTEATSLKTDNAGLQTQLDTTNAKVQLLEEQMAAFKLQMGEEISRANATVTELTQEKEALLSAPKPEPDPALRQELDALKADHDQLKQKYEDLEKTHQRISDLNTHLAKKMINYNMN